MEGTTRVLLLPVVVVRRRGAARAGEGLEGRGEDQDNPRRTVGLVEEQVQGGGLEEVDSL